MSEDSSRPQRWSADFGPPWRVILTAFAVFILSQVLAALLIQVILGLTGKQSIGLDQSAAAQFGYVLVAEGLAAGLVLYIVRRRRLSLSSIGLGRRPQWQDLRRAAIGFLSFYALLIGVSALLSLFFPDLNKGSQDVGFNHLNTSSDHLLALLALVILPPLGEEPLMRGYLYSGLRHRMSFLAAMLVTSLLFGLAHLQTGQDPGLLWVAGLNTFVLSVVLVYLRETSGALYAGMLVHSLNNLVAFGVHFHAYLF